MLHKPLAWKVMFMVTSKPTPHTVFNLHAPDWVHCEEETVAYTQLSQNTYELVIFKVVYFAPKKYLHLLNALITSNFLYL